MRVLGFRQRKSGPQVPRKKRLLLDDWNHQIVEFPLSIFSVLRVRSFLWFRSKGVIRSTNSWFLLLFSLSSFEVLVVKDSWDLEMNGNSSRGCNDIGLIQTTNRNSVDTEWTIDKQKTRFLQLFQKNTSLASIRTRNHD